MWDNELLKVNYGPRGAGQPMKLSGPAPRPETHDYRGRRFDSDTLDLRRMTPGDTILTDGATIVIRPGGVPQVSLNKGYENGRSAGRRGPVFLPPGPPNADLDLNRAEARGNPPWWLMEKVPNRRPWDYKQKGPQYQPFGNFNFGSVGSAAGLPTAVTERGAGWAQSRAGTSDPSFGSYITGSGSYGDDPIDQYWIEQGARYDRRR